VRLALPRDRVKESVGITAVMAAEEKDGVRRVLVGKAANPPIGPYSHAVVAGGMVYVSGQGGRDPATGNLVGGGVAEQTAQTLRNVGAILGASGSGLDRVVKVTAYLRDMKDFAAFNEAYARVFGEAKPARTTVQAVLPRPDMMVEIDVIAKA
jgi:2-iminobutanoate/2-iminopropanoate deaminase